jgi:nanoRNase/pAp phosphatase (c-di-AMP/oligoRNAs hydrolase)
MIEINQIQGVICGPELADINPNSQVRTATVDNKLRAKEAELLKLRSKGKLPKDVAPLGNGQPSGLAKDPDIADDLPMRKDTPPQSGSYDATETVFSALKKATGKKLLIAIKGYPDPDNIATALTLQWLASHYDIHSTIIHFEEISHHENRALVKKLDLELEQWTPERDLSEFSFFSINDSQSVELPFKLPAECELLTFVDHHRTLGTVRGHFVDIREQVGSTSAIYAQYLMDSPVPFTGDNPEETRIATALMHGIRTDTDNFVNATAEDFRASEYIAKFVDKDLLALISRQSIPAKTMDLTQVALQRKDIRSNFMFCGVGFVREEDRDGIGQCADYLLNREGIDTVIVYGVVGNEFIDGSLRTKSHVLDPDKWLKDVFGQDKNGNYYGGGRKDKGGFQIPLGVLARCPDKELLWILIKKTMDELFYEKIGIEGKPSTDTESN